MDIDLEELNKIIKEPLVEETSESLNDFLSEYKENKADLIEGLGEYLLKTSAETIQNDLDSLKKYNQLGPTCEDYLQSIKK